MTPEFTTALSVREGRPLNRQQQQYLELQQRESEGLQLYKARASPKVSGEGIQAEVREALQEVIVG